MAPWPAGTANCMARPRDLTARTASAKLNVPAATWADHSPSECPAARAGSTPCAASTRQAATLTVRMAGWVFSVRRRSSSGPSKINFEIGKPSASSASAKVWAAMGKRSARSRPMPTACEPCPGKRKAILVDIPERFYRKRTPFEILGIPPMRQKEGAWMGHGAIEGVSGTESVPALFVVGVVVDLFAVAVEADGAAMGAHVDLELAGGAAALPAVVAIAQPVPSLAEDEGDSAARGQANVEQAGQRSAQLGEGIHALLAEEHGDGDEGVDGNQVAGLDADGQGKKHKL